MKSWFEVISLNDEVIPNGQEKIIHDGKVMGVGNIAVKRQIKTGRFLCEWVDSRVMIAVEREPGS